MSWAGKILRVDLTAGTVKSEALNMDWARAYSGFARVGHQVPGRGGRRHRRSAVARQQNHLGHRPPDRHHGLHRRPLHRDHQGPADRRDCLLQLGRLLGCRAARWPGGTWSFSKAKSPSRCTSTSTTTWPSCAMPRTCGARASGKPKETLRRPARPARPASPALARPVRTACCTPAVGQRLCTVPAGRSGVGTVMGSRNLKAIAVRGTKGVGNIRDPKAFMKAMASRESPRRSNARHRSRACRLRHPGADERHQRSGRLAHPQPPRQPVRSAKDISAEAMATPRTTDGKKQLVTNQACFGCTIACGRISKMDQGHFTVAEQAAVLGRHQAAWSTKPPGRWARPTA